MRGGPLVRRSLRGEHQARTRAGDARGAAADAAIRAYKLAARGTDDFAALLTGPDLPERRYARFYVAKNAMHPYRVRCPRCAEGWVHPKSHRPRCRACYARNLPEGQVERMVALGRSYAGVPTAERRR